jgi:phosphate acetyltransferase
VIFGDEAIIRRLKSLNIPYYGVDFKGWAIIPKTKSTSGKVEVINPKKIDKNRWAELYLKARKRKCPSINQARKYMDDINYLGCMMLKHGEVSGIVSGSSSPTSAVLRPALKLLRDKGATVSSFFFMEKEKKHFFFADCAVNIEPDEKQLASIALETAKSAKQLFKMEPRVAFLSFSTHGSAKHPLADKMRKAMMIAKKKSPKLKIDGELQVDAALFPEICRFKSKGCRLKKEANVLIFPDLECGNISYKLVEWLGKYKAFGPIVQGLQKPVNDLSRGCTVDDIVNVTAITASEIHGG